MNKRGGKSKTRKAVAKRFKITGSGKIKRHKCGKRHLLQNKNRKRKRMLGKSTLVSKDAERHVLENLPFE